MTASNVRGRRLRGRAFSLIELLVVVAIIAILVGLLLPGILGSKKKARRVECQSQLRQLMIALNSYADDHRFVFPDVWPNANSNWVTAIGPFLNKDWKPGFVNSIRPDQRRVFFCPTAFGENQTAKTDAHGTYGMNADVGKVNSTSIQSPSDRIVLADGKWNGSTYWDGGVDFGGTLPDAVHEEGANFAFVDTHVAWLLQADYTASTNEYLWRDAP